MSREPLATTPSPLVDWETAVCAFAPTQEPTRGRYRTIRQRGQVTSGIQVQRRVHQRAAGSRTVHSALVVFAAHALRENNYDLAAHLLDGARRVESEFSEPIKEFLADHDVDALSTASFYRGLVVATAAVLSDAPSWRKLFFARGVLGTVEDENAHVSAITDDGEDVELDLPRALLDQWHLVSGDGVFVFRNLLPTSAALVELFPTAGKISKRSKSSNDDEAFDALTAAAHPRRSQSELERLRALSRSNAAGRRSLRPAG